MVSSGGENALQLISDLVWRDRCKFVPFHSIAVPTPNNVRSVVFLRKGGLCSIPIPEYQNAPIMTRFLLTGDWVLGFPKLGELASPHFWSWIMNWAYSLGCTYWQVCALLNMFISTKVVSFLIFLQLLKFFPHDACSNAFQWGNRISLKKKCCTIAPLWFRQE